MKTISTENAPAAIGPYSQAIVAGGFVFCSGQIPIDPKTGHVVHANLRDQTRLVLDNLTAVLEAAGSSLDRVVKVTVYMHDLQDFGAMNEVYAEFFTDHKPARAAVEVRRLPKDVWVEMDAIATVA